MWEIIFDKWTRRNNFLRLNIMNLFKFKKTFSYSTKKFNEKYFYVLSYISRMLDKFNYLFIIMVNSQCWERRRNSVFMHRKWYKTLLVSTLNEFLYNFCWLRFYQMYTAYCILYTYETGIFSFENQMFIVQKNGQGYFIRSIGHC